MCTICAGDRQAYSSGSWVALPPMAQAPRLLGTSGADFRPDLDPTGELAAKLVGMLAGPLRAVSRRNDWWTECGRSA
jgi:hypothetical protein